MRSRPSSRTETLASLLETAVTRFPRLAFHSFFHRETRSAAELLEQSHRIAAGLREQGAGRGDRVGVLLPTSLDLLATYFGVFASGAALVPLAVPTRLTNVEHVVTRLRTIARHSGLRLIVTDAAFGALTGAPGTDPDVTSPSRLLTTPARPSTVDVEPDELAVVQYTSGSTASPKGVALTHAQALAGVRAAATGGRLTEADVYCSWLPMSHDMGLMSVLSHATAGADVHLSPPAAFIKRPGDWLEHFARVRATVYIGPNFSYQYLLDGVDDGLLRRLDLSAWRLALNGAETIDPLLMERFTERFGAAGFRREAMYPVYGLAEATVAVSFPEPGEPPFVEWVNRDALCNRAEVERLPQGHPRARGVVAVGRPLPGLEVRIVRPGADDVLGPGRVGEIEVRGPSVMSGYYRDAERTAEALHGDWLRTGDLGWLSEGRLFVSGRLKETMKIQGETWFPEDVEAAVRELPGVYRHRCVAFADVDGTAERIALVVETDLADAERRRLGLEARRQVAVRLGVDALDVYVVPPRTILRTTSGKYQRLGMRELLRSGTLGERVHPDDGRG